MVDMTMQTYMLQPQDHNLCVFTCVWSHMCMPASCILDVEKWQVDLKGFTKLVACAFSFEQQCRLLTLVADCQLQCLSHFYSTAGLEDAIVKVRSAVLEHHKFVPNGPSPRGRYMRILACCDGCCCQAVGASANIAPSWKHMHA
jgi:hypothetical protein